MARLIAASIWVPLISFCAASPVLAQARLGGGEAPDVSIVRVLLALLLCLMVGTGAIFLLKRGGGKLDLAAVKALLVQAPAERRIHVIEARRISQHADLCLVRCDGRDYLILTSQQQQVVLREDAVPVAGSAS